MYFSVLTTYSYSFGGSKKIFPTHCLGECDRANESMTAPPVRGGEREKERDREGERCAGKACVSLSQRQERFARWEEVRREGVHLFFPKSNKETHSYKLDRFASIQQNVTEKAILTLLERRSRSLIIAFPSSATSPPRAHTPTQPSGKPSGVCECV